MTEHTAATCPHSWCTAHQPDELCRCPYAAASPHPRDGCRYATPDEPADDDAAERHHA